MGRKKKLTIVVNNLDSLQDLLQEVYHDACGMIVDAQNTINTVTSGSEPQDTDDHVKLAKAKTDALKLKESGIKLKLDIGRLQNEVIKNQGALPEDSGKIEASGEGASLDAFSKLRKMMEEEKKKNEG